MGVEAAAGEARGELRAAVGRAARSGLIALCATAAIWQLADVLREAAPGAAFPDDYAARFAPLAPLLPRDGPLVQVFDGVDVAFVGFWSYPELVNPTFELALRDPELERRIAAHFFAFNLTVQALAPRIVVRPDNPIFAHVELIVGNFDRAEDIVPPGEGLIELANPGNGVVLWRRP